MMSDREWIPEEISPEYDPSVELGLATIEDIASELAHREGCPPGVITWLPGIERKRPEHPVVATFGGPRGAVLRYLASIVLDVERYERERSDDFPNGPTSA